MCAQIYKRRKWTVSKERCADTESYFPQRAKWLKLTAYSIAIIDWRQRGDRVYWNEDKMAINREITDRSFARG
jgi:hypothetical protein